MRFFVLTAILILMFYASPAQARRGIGLVGMYEDVEQVADLPDALPFQAEGQNVNFGYKYRVFHAFYLPLFVTVEDKPFIMYLENGSSFRYYQADDRDVSQVISAIGSDPREQFSFNSWTHMWGWLIVLPAGYALFALKMLRADRAEPMQQQGLSMRESRWTLKPDTGPTAQGQPEYRQPDNERPILAAKSPAPTGGGFGRKGL